LLVHSLASDKAFPPPSICNCSFTHADPPPLPSVIPSRPALPLSGYNICQVQEAVNEHSSKSWYVLFKSLPRNASKFSPRHFDLNYVGEALIPPQEIIDKGVNF